jgi:hypothetical protein
MAALTITTTQVLLISGDWETARCGEAITQGMGVYKSATTGYWLKAQCDGTADEAGATDSGIALNATGASGQPVTVAKAGAVVDLGAGAAAAAGTPYFVGATAGALNVLGDLSSTNKVTQIATGIGTNYVLVERIYHASAVKP